jgi:hypothetical protein
MSTISPINAKVGQFSFRLPLSAEILEDGVKN